MWRTCFILLSILGLVLFVSATFYHSIDDNILHKINWAGKILEETPLDETLTTVLMTSARNEKYKCVLPKPQDSANDDRNSYTGLTPFELISPLFSQFVCTFKLETFWTYELCHGKYIRQYHEDRDGKKLKLQEYYLGRWDKEDMNTARQQFEVEFAKPEYRANLPVKKIEGVNMPALQLNMSDGTICDLNGEPRNTRVLYVCDPRGKHELHSLEEVSTCEYELVVLSPLLCQHPDFKPKEVGDNAINCYSTDNAPQIPKALSELDNESFKLKHENLLNLESLLESKIKSEKKHFTDDELLTKAKITMTPITSGLPIYDNSFLAAFLEGKECLTGGSHWWKFEFCYGKHVLQYHEEQPGGSRTQIMLGKWDVEKHREYLDQNPHKKPALTSLKRAVYHYYSGGAQCDHTGEPRTVEVKLRCVDHPNPSAVSLYLLEPKTCEYTLTVESGLFCTLLSSATSDYGLIDASEFIMAHKTPVRMTGGGRLKKVKGDDNVSEEDKVAGQQRGRAEEL